MGFIAIPAVLFKGMTLPNISLSSKNPDETAAPLPNKRTNARSIVLFMALVLGRGLCYMGTVTFIPLMFHEKDGAPTLMGASPASTGWHPLFLGWCWATWRIMWTSGASSPSSWFWSLPFIWLLAGSNGGMAFVYVLLAGMLGQGLHSVMIVMGQHLLPGARASSLA
ncbi:MAG UNVERIFIED_CONTAM: hypothetical protein LVT10_13285 [Anaerolineae bacterium]